MPAPCLLPGVRVLGVLDARAAFSMPAGCQACCFATSTYCCTFWEVFGRVLRCAPDTLCDLQYHVCLPAQTKMTPKAFIHRIHEICRANLQHVVLPEVGGARLLPPPLLRCRCSPRTAAYCCCCCCSFTPLDSVPLLPCCHSRPTAACWLPPLRL